MGFGGQHDQLLHLSQGTAFQLWGSILITFEHAPIYWDFNYSPKRGKKAHPGTQ